MDYQTNLSKRLWKPSTPVLLFPPQAVFVIFSFVVAIAHAQQFSWQLPYIDSFNPALTATSQTEPPQATCGYPGTMNTYFNSSSGIRRNCSTQCHASRKFPNKTSEYVTVHKSYFLELPGGSQLWQDNCDAELFMEYIRRRAFANNMTHQVAKPYCFVYSEDLSVNSSQETHMMMIRHSHHILDGVVLDSQNHEDIEYMKSTSLSLRVRGSTFRLEYGGTVRVYNNPAPPDTWTQIAIQHDPFKKDDGQSLFVNGNYLTPFDVIRSSLNDSTAHRRLMEPVYHRISFGMVGDTLLLEMRPDYLRIQQCKDIRYSAIVSIAHWSHDLANQETLAEHIFNSNRQTSIYNCPHDEDQLTRFACAFYLPAMHTSIDWDLEWYSPCRRLCEEIQAACGATLDAVPLLGNLSCDEYADEKCVDTDYIPYVGIFDGEIEDYRYYNNVLTNREILALATGELAPASPTMPIDFSDCLCPPEYPVIYTGSHLCVTNQAHDDNADITRGEAWASVRYWDETLHVPELATDLDPYTAWVSAEGTLPVALVIEFPRIYRVLGLTFTLVSPFPKPSEPDVRAIDIALLSSNGTWHTVYYLDQSCEDASSSFLFESDKYHPNQVVCVSPSERLQHWGRQYDVDLLLGRSAYLNEISVNPELQSLLDGRGVRLRFNAAPANDGAEDVPHLSHIVSELQVHAGVFSHRTLCGCYAQGTDMRGQCSDSGQCPCRSDNGDPQHGGQKCEPYVLNVVPTYGPLAGGTKILILGGFFGKYGLNSEQRYIATDDIHFTFEKSDVTCASIRANQTFIECVTQSLSSSSELINTPLQLTVQFSSGFQLHGDKLVFTYKLDPVIRDIDPLKSFFRGGIIQTVVGMEFNSVAYPFMNLTVIINGNTPSPQPTPTMCTVFNNTLMHCPSPTIDPRIINPLGRRRRDVERVLSLDDVIVEVDVLAIKGRSIRVKRQTTAVNLLGMYEFEIGFILDGVPTYRNITEALGPKKGQLLVHNDPDFEEWDPETLSFRPYDNDEYIDVRGSRMNFGAELSDYRVMISREECEVVELNTNKLTCRPPSSQPKHDSFSKDGAHRVWLEVGAITIHVGYLKYYMSLLDEPTFSIAIAVAILLIGILAISVVILVKMVKMVKRVHGQNMEEAAQEDSYVERKCMLMDMLDPDLKMKIAECLIEPHTRMTLGREVGRGNFGKVYSGVLTMPGQVQPRDCAVKTLKDDSQDVKELREFLEEATIMKDFKHPNVLTLYGVVIMQNKPHVLLPFMAHGDIRGYVKNPRNKFSVEELLNYGLQIANGMEYLSHNKFVHRDLAARNCMLDEEKVVKIADFGLARDIYERDYYAVEDRRRPIPIKWMAPECLETFKFDSRSDVWSYGVTLWEIMMHGCQPYPGIDNLDLKRFLQRGGRLDKPSFCPDTIYALMKDCWNINPHSRPMFSLIAKHISDTIDADRQIETLPSSSTSEPYDHLQMVTMNRHRYVPLTTAAPSEEATGNANDIQSNAPSQRYTDEPGKQNNPQDDLHYLKPFIPPPKDRKRKATDEKSSVKTKNDTAC